MPLKLDLQRKLTVVVNLALSECPKKATRPFTLKTGTTAAACSNDIKHRSQRSCRQTDFLVRNIG
jgi:hypothetical protein